MTVKAKNYKLGDMMDYLNSSGALISGGDPVQICDGIIGIPTNDIANGASDSLQIGGIIAVEAAAVIGNAGDNIWYDANGSPVGGTASSGAATTSAPDGDYWLGTLAVALTAADGIAYIFLNKANPSQPHHPGRVHELTSIDLTLDIQDTGKVIHFDTDTKTITMPVIATGMDVIIVNDAADAAVAIPISPNSDDKIQGANLAGTNNKDLILTKLTSIRGDFVHLVSGPNVDGWTVGGFGMRGIWATEG